MTENDILSNQTNFFSDELMEQSPPTLPIEPDPFQAQKDELNKKRKKLFVLLGSTGIAVLCIGGAVVLLLVPTTTTQQTVIPSPIVITSQTQKSSLYKRIDELESDLKNADPIEVEQPLPPISFELFLDQIDD